MPRFVRPAILFAPLLLIACGAADDDTAPGGVTQGEAAALNDAAAMLDDDAMAPEAANAQS